MGEKMGESKKGGEALKNSRSKGPREGRSKNTLLLRKIATKASVIGKRRGINNAGGKRE